MEVCKSPIDIRAYAEWAYNLRFKSNINSAYLHLDSGCAPMVAVSQLASRLF